MWKLKHSGWNDVVTHDLNVSLQWQREDSMRNDIHKKSERVSEVLRKKSVPQNSEKRKLMFIYLMLKDKFKVAETNSEMI